MSTRNNIADFDIRNVDSVLTQVGSNEVRLRIISTILAPNLTQAKFESYQMLQWYTFANCQRKAFRKLLRNFLFNLESLVTRAKRNRDSLGS